MPPAFAEATAGKPWGLGLQVDPTQAGQSAAAAPFRAIDGGRAFDADADDVLADRNSARPDAWWRRPLPAWAQAAAALLIFSSGLSLGAGRNLATREPNGGADRTATAGSVTAGSRTGVATPRPASAVTPVTTVTPEQLASLEQQLRQLQTQVAQLKGAAPAAAPDVTLATVRELVADTESRLQRQMVLRDADVTKTFFATRTGDMQRLEERIDKVIEPMQRVHGQELWQQNQPALAIPGQGYPAGGRVIGLRTASFTR
jgi:hypothetical protein